MSEPWFIPFGRSDRGMRVFCLPYAGGGSSLFKDWRDEAEFDPIAIELPGRCRRFGEPSARSMEEIVEPLLQAFEPYLERPFSLYGHSLGAMIAFELAQALRSRYGVCPAHLVVAAVRPPARVPTEERPWGQGEEALLRRLRFAGGTPPELLQNDELLALIAPVLEADFSVIDGYCNRWPVPLSCPLTSMAGAEDPLASPHAVRGWCAETTGAYRHIVLPGDHFFIRSAQRALLDRLNDIFAPVDRRVANPF